MAAAAGFRLDGDQRQSLQDCLDDAGASLLVSVDRFFERIEASIDHCCRTKPEGTPREAYDSLSEIWQLCQRDHPCPKRLRMLLYSLSPVALEYLERRAPRVLFQLVGMAIEHEPFARRDGIVFAWAKSAPDDELVRVLPALVQDGGRWVQGRSRGRGKRSAPRFEPRIMGVVRGSPEAKSMGGRPRKEATRTLVMHLAGVWCRSTGRIPGTGRSDRCGFGKLVHMVFQWIFVPGVASQEAIDAAIERATEVASNCLRQYWKDVKQGLARPSLEDFLGRHPEES
jgi:hypothetical protein